MAEPPQRGFVRGRNVLDNLSEVDSAMLKWAVMDISPRFGTALFYIKAAFPNVSHAFIWAVLEALNIPSNVRRAIKSL